MEVVAETEVVTEMIAAGAVVEMIAVTKDAVAQKVEATSPVQKRCY